MNSATLALLLMVIAVTLVVLGCTYLGLRVYARRRGIRLAPWLPERARLWGRRAFVLLLAITTLAVMVVSLVNLTSNTTPIPSPSPSGQPSVTPTPSPSPTTTQPSGASEVTVWKYDPDKFRDISGHWKPDHRVVAGGGEVYALGTRTRGCGPDSLRLLRYPGLPTDRSKTLQFSAGLSASSRTKDTPVSGKVQFKQRGSDDWSSPETFTVRYGSVSTLRFPAGEAQEILVSYFPSVASCSRADVVVIEFDAQIEFRK